MFRYGEIATPAMALLAENGDTKKLEIDMKSSSHNIRSVIKARFSITWVLNSKFNLVPWHWSFGSPMRNMCLRSSFMVIHGQGASAEVQRCWSNFCSLSDGRHKTSFVSDLQNHPKVT